MLLDKIVMLHRHHDVIEQKSVCLLHRPQVPSFESWQKNIHFFQLASRHLLDTSVSSIIFFEKKEREMKRTEIIFVYGNERQPRKWDGPLQKCIISMTWNFKRPKIKRIKIPCNPPPHTRAHNLTCTHAHPHAKTHTYKCTCKIPSHIFLVLSPSALTLNKF